MGENVDKIEIEVRRLHSQTYIVRAWKHQIILELKEQLAVVSGIISERQRLLFRTRVLNNNQRLSDYQIGNGHTLYLVVGVPNPQTESGNGGGGLIVRRHRYFHPFPLQPDPDPNTEVIPDALTLLRYAEGSGDYHLWIEQRRRELIIGELRQGLFYSMLETLATYHTIPQIQSLEQGRVIESEVLTMDLRNTLIELGRAISRMARGEIPDYAVLEPRNRSFPPPTAQSNQPHTQTRHVGLRFIWHPIERVEASDAASSQQNVSSSEAQPTTEIQIQ